MPFAVLLIFKELSYNGLPAGEDRVMDSLSPLVGGGGLTGERWLGSKMLRKIGRIAAWWLIEIIRLI